MALEDILKILGKHKFLVIILPLMMLVASGLFVYFVVPYKYSNQIKIYVEPRVAEESSRTLSSNFNSYYGYLESQQLCNDVAEIIKSKHVAECVKEENELNSLDDYEITTKSSEKNRVITLTVEGYDQNKVPQVTQSIITNTINLSSTTANIQKINQIDEVYYPNVPSSPNKPIVVIIIFMSFLIICIIIALIIDVFNDKIFTSNEIKEKFNIPIYAELPKHSIFKWTKNNNAIYKFLKEETCSTYLNRLFQSIVFDKNKDNVISIVSRNKYEGKSSIASSLAYKLSTSGFSTLIIDANWTNQSITNAIDVIGYNYSSQLQAYKTSINNNLYIMPFGEHIRCFSKLFTNDNFLDFFYKLKMKYDYIIFDTPAFKECAETSFICNFSDTSVVIVRSKLTKLKDIENIIADSKETHWKIKGIVITDVKV